MDHAGMYLDCGTVAFGKSTAVQYYRIYINLLQACLSLLKITVLSFSTNRIPWPAKGYDFFSLLLQVTNSHAGVSLRPRLAY